MRHVLARRNSSNPPANLKFTFRPNRRHRRPLPLICARKVVFKVVCYIDTSEIAAITSVCVLLGRNTCMMIALQWESKALVVCVDKHVRSVPFAF